MTFGTRIKLFVTLILLSAGSVAAQETTATTGTPESQPTANEIELRKYDVRNSFTRLLRQSANDELPTVLVLEPNLLSNEAFLGRYPDLAKFVAAHPDIRSNPGFYLVEFQPRPNRGVLADTMEVLLIFLTFAVVAFALGWLVRTIIEQKRWNRLTRSQNEVHNKILDRFGSSAELLEYIRTPAGSKFLESAPIALHAQKAPNSPNAPMTRILWSIQLGVVLVAVGLGILLVSLRFTGETGQDVFALGMIGFSVGIGFIASAYVSLTLSRKFGLSQGQTTDSGLVR